MARYLILVATALLVGSFGCQTQNPDLADRLPEPNFNGPVVVAPAQHAPTGAMPLPAEPPQIATRDLPGDRGWSPSARPRPWKWIVIHHSATSSGSAAEFDRAHKAKGWDELGYHFVIGNGAGSGNGQVEVGPRWPKQKWGAHAKTPDNRYNDYGIGICLVGNFDIERPTPQQLQSLARLTAWLMQKYHIPAGNVVGHRDTKQTDCPGRNMNVAVVRRMATQMLAEAGQSIPDDSPRLAGGNLLQDQR